MTEEVIKIPVVHKGVVYRTEKGTCSFCRKTARTIKRMAKDKQICDECVYRATIAIDEEGKYERGQVICKGCNNWQAIRLYAIEGGSMTFKGYMIEVGDDKEIHTDDDGMTVYTVGSSTDRITSEKKTLKAFQCMMCDRELPSWYLNHNTYLQQYFKHAPPRPTQNKTP